MPSPEERRQLEAVYGVVRKPIIPPWKQVPTPIAIPTNRTVFQSQAKGVNPFARNLNNRNRRQSEQRVGEQTPSRNTTGTSRDDGPGPSKRQKMDGSDYRYSSGRGHITSNRTSSSRPPLAPEDMTIMENDNYDADPDEQRLATKHRKSSPDELNIASQPSSISKYSFFRPSTQARGRHKATDIVPDGSDTERAMKTYFIEDSDDPIEDPDEPMPLPRKGQVRQAVERIDQINSHSPKIDLAMMQKPLSRSRGMKPKHIKPPEIQAKRTTVYPDAKLQFNRVATSQTPVLKEYGPLPIEDAYLEYRNLSQSKGQKFRMFWSSHSVSIKADEIEVYRLSLTPENCETVTYSDTPRSSPILQLKPVDGQSFVTVRFNVKDPEWSLKQYENFTKMASKVAKVETIKNDEVIWELACRLADENNKATARSKKPTRMEILHDIQEKKVPSLQPFPGTRKRKASFVLPPSSPLTDPPDSPEPAPESKVTPQILVQYRSVKKPTVTTSNVRRSARNAHSEKTEPTDPDELILVYPPGPGAVNITKGDLHRLGPLQYLNDTLIEFGLKLWLKNLSESNPEFASKIHIFNSFFYKKLNHAKDVQQAFESVKKWTSKIDIFEKKYVIVPINEHFHWYLAIICEPEHVLSSRTSRVPNERKKTRSTAQAGVLVSDTAPAKNDKDDERDDQNVTSSEAEVERNLNDDFQSSCTIETHDFDLRIPLDATEEDDAKSLEALSYVTDDGEELDRSNCDDFPSTSTSVRPGDFGDKEIPSTPSSIDMAVDSTEENSALPEHVAIGGSDPHHPRVKNGKGKEKAVPGSDVVIMENGIEGAVSAESHQQTYIFIMDSLGTRHPQAVKKLSKYLVMEAKDKKGVPDAGEAEGRFALVPVQPNFCDCGLYLLHFAQTFMKNPAYYTKNILSQAKHIPNQQRQVTWEDEEVAKMRDTLGHTIVELSKSWKEEREREEVDKAPSEAGSDVQIVEPKKIQVEPDKKQTKKRSKANRIRG